MNKEPKRYIFIDYENLKKIKIKKLQRICDKFFVLINDINESIPFSLVTKMQKLGKGVKWISVNTLGTHNLNYHIAFLLGKLHHKEDLSVEFIVISNDEEILPLVNYISESGRYCIRVRRNNRTVKDTTGRRSKGKNEQKNNYSTDSSKWHGIGVEERKRQLDEMINESIKRLVVLDDRPDAVSDLCDFIFLHNQERAVHFEMNEVVLEMKKRKEIEIVEDEQVIYCF